MAGARLALALLFAVGAASMENDPYAEYTDQPFLRGGPDAHFDNGRPSWKVFSESAKLGAIAAREPTDQETIDQLLEDRRAAAFAAEGPTMAEGSEMDDVLMGDVDDVAVRTALPPPAYLDEKQGTFHELYRNADSNGDGALNAEELATLLAAMGDEVTVDGARDIITSQEMKRPSTTAQEAVEGNLSFKEVSSLLGSWIDRR